MSWRFFCLGGVPLRRRRWEGSLPRVWLGELPLIQDTSISLQSVLIPPSVEDRCGRNRRPCVIISLTVFRYRRLSTIASAAAHDSVCITVGSSDAFPERCTLSEELRTEQGEYMWSYDRCYPKIVELSQRDSQMISCTYSFSPKSQVTPGFRRADRIWF